MSVTTLAGIIFTSFLLFGTLGFAENTPPSQDTIQSWWKQISREAMTIEGEPLRIGLRSKEVGYLVPVGFYDRGRNFIWHMALIRPAIKQVREVEEPVKQDIVVHDLNHDGISEVEALTQGSGQGTEQGEKSIVQFDGWKPIVLHRAEFYNNLGACGPEFNTKCESKEVNWKFVDLDGDGNDDLVEESVIEKGPSLDRTKSKKTVIKYLFKNNAFVQMKAPAKRPRQHSLPIPIISQTPW